MHCVWKTTAVWVPEQMHVNTNLFRYLCVHLDLVIFSGLSSRPYMDRRDFVQDPFQNPGKVSESYSVQHWKLRIMQARGNLPLLTFILVSQQSLYEHSKAISNAALRTFLWLLLLWFVLILTRSTIVDRQWSVFASMSHEVCNNIKLHMQNSSIVFIRSHFYVTSN